MQHMWDLAIVGGGASGMAAAIFAARFCENSRIVLLEKQARVGKKLLATGNGTCNLSNRHADVSHYHGAQAAFVKTALDMFMPQDTAVFFNSIGVPCELRENGRMYPACESAAAVLDCMRMEMQARGVSVRCDSAVTALRPCKEGWQVVTAEETLRAKRVLVAAGGAASPSVGGGNDGYALLTALGHTRTPLFPSIVQLRTDTTYVKAVKGLRVDGTVKVWLGDKELASETGEILFTEYGLSGPAVMQVSRAAGDWERKKQGVLTVTLDLMPRMQYEMLYEMLRTRAQMFANRPLEDFLTGLFQRRIGQTLVRASQIGSLSDLCGGLQEEQLHQLAKAIKAWTFEVTGTQGFGGAQVTAGGISTAEFDPHTLQSRKANNLYACGEVLDVDGDCGGYNLQWAWSSAYAAVQAIRRAEEV